MMCVCPATLLRYALGKIMAEWMDVLTESPQEQYLIESCSDSAKA